MNPFYTLFAYAVWFLSTYYIVLFLIILISHRKELYASRPEGKRTPLVSIVIPAYNEEKHISETISSLKEVGYPRIEFIIINDGSTDATADAVRRGTGNDKRFRFIDNARNKGKAACLNQGIGVARGEFIACMDADSVVDSDVLHKTLPYFEDARVGAVTITVEVRNPRTFMQKIAELEFTIGLSLFLKALSFFDGIFVTPGPFSIYRSSVMREIGGFDPKNITEDLEIAYRIHRAGYRIENCLEAKVYTRIPKDFSAIAIQRRRWYSGAILTAIHHRRMFFTRRHGLFTFMLAYSLMLVFVGLSLFIVSAGMGAKRLIDEIVYLRYTGFNPFKHIFDFNIDLLKLSGIEMIGALSILTTIIVLSLGLHYSRKRAWERKIGIIGFPLLFFLYQLYWLRAIYAVLTRRSIKWR